MKIYFDNASTTPLLPEVSEAMYQVLKENYGNPSSIHMHGRKSRTLIEEARKTIAKLIHASIGEIFFTSSATEANNMVLKRSIIDLGVEVIISSPTEHHCVLHTLDSIKHEFPNVEIIMLNVNEYGQIDLDQLTAYLESNNKKALVSLMYGNNEIGTIHPIEEIGKITQSFNALFHCDAVQMLGKYPIDVQTLNVSFLSGTAHKFHGPKGSAFIYIKNENMLNPFIYGGAQERNMRAGTENIAGIVGLAIALKSAHDHMQARKEIVSNLKQRFEDGVLSIPNCKINCPPENAMFHISSVSFPESDTVDMLMFNLDIGGISASSGSACSAGIEEDSHVLVAIKHPAERKTIRFSFSQYNTIKEVDFTIALLKKLCK
jgi:cysteine desulfurase